MSHTTFSRVGRTQQKLWQDRKWIFVFLEVMGLYLCIVKIHAGCLNTLVKRKKTKTQWNNLLWAQKGTVSGPVERPFDAWHQEALPTVRLPSSAGVIWPVFLDYWLTELFSFAGVGWMLQPLIDITCLVYCRMEWDDKTEKQRGGLNS